MIISSLLVVLRTVGRVLSDSFVSPWFPTLLPLNGHWFLQSRQPSLLCLTWGLRLMLRSDLAPPYLLLFHLRSRLLLCLQFQLVHLSFCVYSTWENGRIANTHLLRFLRVVLGAWYELQLITRFSGVHCFRVRALCYSLVVHSFTYRLLFVHNHDVILPKSPSPWNRRQDSVVLMVRVLAIRHLCCSCLTVERHRLIEDIAWRNFICHRSRLRVGSTRHTVPHLHLVPTEWGSLLFAPTLLEMGHLF